MAYDLEEQEQIEAIKAWWQRHGNKALAVVTAVLLVWAAANGWNWWQAKQSREAAQLYDQVAEAVASRDAQRIVRVAADMQDRFPRTAYAQMTALQAAAALVAAHDKAGAATQLRWVVDHGRDAGYQALARLRLAALLIDDAKYDEAAKLLDTSAPAGFEALFAERRGDVFWAQNKLDDARNAYRAALDKATGAEQQDLRQLIQLKLDTLAGA